MPEAQGFETPETPDVSAEAPVTLKFPVADAAQADVHGDVQALIGELEDAANNPETMEAEEDVPSTERQAA